MCFGAEASCTIISPLGTESLGLWHGGSVAHFFNCICMKHLRIYVHLTHHNDFRYNIITIIEIIMGWEIGLVNTIPKKIKKS
jgi:hypothetical protein